MSLYIDVIRKTVQVTEKKYEFLPSLRQFSGLQIYIELWRADDRNGIAAKGDLRTRQVVAAGIR